MADPSLLARHRRHRDSSGEVLSPMPKSVNDALQYLDQVKVEFTDKPEVYNTFLDIMANYRTQEIDTPSVIEKVSTLFEGNNKLILGFNTFLPPDHKLDLKHLEGMQQNQSKDIKGAPPQETMAAEAGEHAKPGEAGATMPVAD